MVNLAKMVIFTAGLLFLMVGLSIAIVENQTYEAQLTPLYVLVMYSFYGMLIMNGVGLLISAADYLKQRGKPN